MFRNLKIVPNLIFGRGCFDQLGNIVDEQRKAKDSIVVFLIDNVFNTNSFRKRISTKSRDFLIWVNVDDEPRTDYVDKITLKIKNYTKSFRIKNPCVVIGIGGGSTMDISKAVSLMLTNAGSSENYQGWDLVKNPGIYHIAVPTLSGTGSEVSRTSVLIGPEKKLGINSDYAVFDQIILDPEMTRGVSKTQRFYTGMDCYIHCVESIYGKYINTFSQVYGQKAMNLCREVFLEDESDADDKLMMASYFGGMSITYSQVGICHALSYGLSFIVGIHHGLGNCVIFNTLGRFYPDKVKEFREMINKQGVSLPKKIVSSLSNDKVDKMVDVSLMLEPLWENALGKNWKLIVTRSDLKKMYLEV